jgi:hypothetical protein
LCFSAAIGCDAAPPSKSDSPVASGTTLLAALTLEKDHTVQFFEAGPGETVTVESGISGVHAPVLTAEMRGRSTSDLYRALTPPQTTVPAALVAADERAAALAQHVADEKLGPVETARGAGPAFYDDGEQQSFRDNYCNGAQGCAQGWDWATIKTNGKISNAYAITFVGSEGHQNASFDVYALKTRCSGFICTSQTTWWDPQYHAVVVPGHFVAVNSNNYNNYLFWSLTGAGTDTQVSLATKF